MAGGIVWAYGLVICGYQLLCPAQRSLVAAMPTTITPGNETVYEQPQGNATLISDDIWQITETAGNESVTEPDDILFRGGWKSKNQSSKVNLETEEGWLNSGMIAQDAFIPYRAVGVSNRLGNGTEDWKEVLVKAEPGGDRRQGRVSKVQFNERRDIPFQFHWQVNPKRFFNSSKTP